MTDDNTADNTADDTADASPDGRSFSGERLDGADFSGQQLEGADFGGADVRGAKFDGANLRSASFDGALIGVRPAIGIALLSVALAISALAGALIGWALEDVGSRLTADQTDEVAEGGSLFLILVVLVGLILWKGFSVAIRLVVIVYVVLLAINIIANFFLEEVDWVRAARATLLLAVLVAAITAGILGRVIGGVFGSWSVAIVAVLGGLASGRAHGGIAGIVVAVSLVIISKRALRGDPRDVFLRGIAHRLTPSLGDELRRRRPDRGRLHGYRRLPCRSPRCDVRRRALGPEAVVARRRARPHHPGNRHVEREEVGLNTNIETRHRPRISTTNARYRPQMGDTMSESAPEVTPIKDGALRVEGLKQLQTADGPVDCQSIVALCRCGQSANKPFCDGTHVKIGFTSDATSGSVPDRRDEYVGKSVTILDNRDICAGAGFCTDGLPTVFDMKSHPWIDVAGDTAQKIIETVRKCPSGALSYAVDGVEHRDDSDRPPSVSVTVAGPYRLKGSAGLDDAEWAQGASEEHFSLCRCGGSQRKPFCDGSHWTVWKDGEDTNPPATEAKGPRPTTDEPYVGFIHDLAVDGLSKFGPDGPMTAMGVPRTELPTWDRIQIMAAQLDPRPLQEGEHVGTDLVIGPNAKKPLHLDIPLFVTDMSYGALSEEAKVSLSKGAELAGTGICSGEGGMLPEEQAANSRYFYEYASGKFGFEEKKLELVQAMHFKCGQGAKTGTGGHLPGSKVVGKIAEVRGLKPGTESISPAAFTDLFTPADFKKFADRARDVSGGIPIGFKLSGNRVERDIDFALEAGADYIILDGRGGATGAAPRIFRDNISVPTIPALARARYHLDRRGVGRDVTLIVTGGLRVPGDFVKAMALGADGIALGNAPIQAVGCIGARMCNTNRCPSGVATQDPALRALIDIEASAKRVAQFFGAAVSLMQTMARACGHDHLGKFHLDDIATWSKEMADLTGIDFAGFNPDRS